MNRKTGLATLTLVLATEAADIDVVSYFGGSVSGFQHHRGFTHTLLGVPVVAAATLLVVYGIDRLMRHRGRRPKIPVNWRLLYLYALLGGLVHIFLDFLNDYGVRPFAPFHPKWYSWDIVYIVDPVILSLLCLGLVMPALLALVSEEVGGRKPAFRGRAGAALALVCIVVVILVRDFEHRKTVNALKAVLHHGEDPLRVSAYPMPLNPFLWKGVVETQDLFEVSAVNPLENDIDVQGSATIRYKPQETPVTLAAKKSQLGRVFLDWAKYPLVEVDQLARNEGYKVRFIDLRFADPSLPARDQVLSGYVVLDPQLHPIRMGMGRDSASEK